MSRLFRFTVAVAALAAPTLTLASTWEIDPAHTSAQFAVRHLVISTVRGQLGKVTGAITLDDTDLTKSSVDATIDTQGIDTREAKRDENLRGPDFLDVAKYPTITFKSKQVEKVSDDTYKVSGDLTIRGVTKEVELDVQYAGVVTNPWGQQVVGFSASTELDREDFGMTWNAALETGGVLVGRKLKIEIEAEAVRQA